jgi:2-polyprenyl-6-methoxyphenol hydroxylase-like FAD-dependent oxidoreductase
MLSWNSVRVNGASYLVGCDGPRSRVRDLLFLSTTEDESTDYDDHRVVVLVHRDHLVPAAYLGPEFAGTLVEHVLESWLGERQRMQRGDRQGG